MAVAITIDIMKPTALTLSPDQAMLLVADGMDRYQWSFQIAADGSLVNGEPFQRLEMPEEGLFSGVGGLTVDSLGSGYRPAELATSMSLS